MTTFQFREIPLGLPVVGPVALLQVHVQAHDWSLQGLAGDLKRSNQKLP